MSLVLAGSFFTTRATWEAPKHANILFEDKQKHAGLVSSTVPHCRGGDGSEKGKVSFIHTYIYSGNSAKSSITVIS